MNNKELATLVYKHQLIQEILKKEKFDPSVINRLIVEEVLGENEETSPVDKLKKAATEALRKNPNLEFSEWARSIYADYSALEGQSQKNLVNKHFEQVKKQKKSLKK